MISKNKARWLLDTHQRHNFIVRMSNKNRAILSGGGVLKKQTNNNTKYYHCRKAVNHSDKCVFFHIREQKPPHSCLSPLNSSNSFLSSKERSDDGSFPFKLKQSKSSVIIICINARLFFEALDRLWWCHTWWKSLMAMFWATRDNRRRTKIDRILNDFTVTKIHVA